MFWKESNCWCPLSGYSFVLLLHFFTVFAQVIVRDQTIVSLMRTEPAELREIWHTRSCWFWQRLGKMVFDGFLMNFEWIFYFWGPPSWFHSKNGEYRDTLLLFLSWRWKFLSTCPILVSEKQWHLENLCYFSEIFLENNFPSVSRFTQKLNTETLNCIPFPLQVFPLERFVLLSY